MMYLNIHYFMDNKLFFLFYKFIHLNYTKFILFKFHLYTEYWYSFITCSLEILKCKIVIFVLFIKVYFNAYVIL